MSVLIDAEIDTLLETTSRSFYPTLKYLPKKIRGQIGLLYLLARVADTIADSKAGETSLLITALTQYNDVAQGRTSELPDLSELADIQTNPAEAELLRNVEMVVNALPIYEQADQQRILECLDIIVGGQILDLQRFGIAKEGGTISSLDSEEELDDYTFRVAGCVGVFWTKMSLAHMMKLPKAKEELFFEHGIRFGKALQMINILRDIPEDLRFGRCYIPGPSLEQHGLTPSDDLTSEHLDAAVEYIRMIPDRQFRLKAASMLPVLIGQRTVTLLREGNILDSDEKIKVTRDEMKGYFKKLLRALIIPGGVQRLLAKNKNA